MAAIMQLVFFSDMPRNPDSLESATAKAAWLDECGQKLFKVGELGSDFEAAFLFHMGRVLLTTTPYILNWLKTLIWDKRYSDPDIEVVNFRSIDKPLLPTS